MYHAMDLLHPNVPHLFPLQVVVCHFGGSLSVMEGVLTIFSHTALTLYLYLSMGFLSLSISSAFPINIPFLAVTVSVLRLILPISLPLNARYLPVFAPLSQDCEQVTVVEGGVHQGQSCEVQMGLLVRTKTIDTGYSIKMHHVSQFGLFF